MGERPGSLSGHESPQDIRRDIAETQREMSHTIDEIQYRLSPAHMKAQARESVRRAGVRTTRGTIDRVKANPLGAALIGAGLYLLLRNPHDEYDQETRYSGDFADRERYARYGSTGYGAGAGGYGAAGSGDRYNAQGEYRDFDYGDADNGGSRMTEAKERVSGAMHDASSAVSGAMHDASSAVSGAMDDVRDRASNMAESAADHARRLRSQASYGARRVSMRGRDMLTQNPLVVGVAAMAFGAVIGAMLPETDRENEMLGEMSDRVTDKIGDVARTGVDQAKNIATAVTTAAKDAATDAAKRETRTAKEEISSELGR